VNPNAPRLACAMLGVVSTGEVGVAGNSRLRKFYQKSDMIIRFVPTVFFIEQRINSVTGRHRPVIQARKQESQF
jgi:hypothetical protein